MTNSLNGSHWGKARLPLSSLRLPRQYLRELNSAIIDKWPKATRA